MMRHVDICSGIGGFALGFQWAELSSPVLFCDIEPWSRKVLAKHWPDVPIAEDVKELANDPDGLVPDCDIITAGYPCQPFSLAGERRGTEDDRHIWPYILSVVEAKRPAWCVFENVYGHVSMGLDEVLSDLEGESYAARPFIVPACAADAPHRRDRVWIIARNVGDTDSKQRRATQKDRGVDLDRAVLDQRQGREKTDAAERSGGNVAYSDSARDHMGDRTQRHWPERAQQDNSLPDAVNAQMGKNWLPEPAVGRVANGIPEGWTDLELRKCYRAAIAMRIGQTIKAVMTSPGHAHNNVNNSNTGENNV